MLQFVCGVFMLTRHLAIALAALWAPALLAAAPLSLDEAIAQALQRSQATRSAHADKVSAAEVAHAAGQLPDPMLVASVENLPVTGPDRFSIVRESMTMKRIGLSQEWLSADKRSARQSAAQALASREAVMEAAAQAQTRLQTALAYLETYYAGEALKLAQTNERHAHEALEASKGRLAAPGGSPAEVLGLTAALGMAEDETSDARQLHRAATVALERWTGVPTDILVAAELPVPPEERSFVDAHPDVAAKERDIDVARLEASATLAERQPNWTWEFSYGQRTGYADLVSVGVSIPLPVARANRQDRNTAAKLALVDKARADRVEALRAAQAEYATWTGDAQRLQARIDRYRVAVLAPTQQRTAVTTAAYRSNQASLELLFDARHAALEAERKLLSLQRDLARTQAQLAYRPIALQALPGDAP